MSETVRPRNWRPIRISLRHVTLARSDNIDIRQIKDSSPSIRDECLAKSLTCWGCLARPPYSRCEVQLNPAVAPLHATPGSPATRRMTSPRVTGTKFSNQAHVHLDCPRLASSCARGRTGLSPRPAPRSVDVVADAFGRTGLSSARIGRFARWPQRIRRWWMPRRTFFASGSVPTP